MASFTYCCVSSMKFKLRQVEGPAQAIIIFSRPASFVYVLSCNWILLCQVKLVHIWHIRLFFEFFLFFFNFQNLKYSSGFGSLPFQTANYCHKNWTKPVSGIENQSCSGVFNQNEPWLDRPKLINSQFN